jgi:signal transduction histidine kinase
MPEYLFTRAVFLASLSWAVLIHFADALSNKAESFPLRFGFVLLSHLFLFGLWWVVKKSFLDFLKPGFVPLVFFTFILIGSALRGLVFQFLLAGFDLSVQTNYIQRAWTSALNMTLVTTLSILVVANLNSQRSLRTRLLLDADRLEFAKKASSIAMGDASPETAQRIKRDLLMKLQEMRQSSLPLLLAQIRTMIDEVVRPLSRTLDESEQSWTPPVIDLREHRIGFRSAFKESMNASQINYLFVPIFMTVLTTPAILARSSALNAFVVFPATIFTVSLWSYFVVKIIGPRWNTAFSYFFLTSLNATVFAFSTLIFTRDFEKQYSLFMPAIVFYITWSLVLSFLKTLFRLNTEANMKLDEFTNELAWQVAHLRERSFQNKRKLAAALHGQVQAKLASTYLQLSALDQADPKLDSKIEPLFTELAKTIESIDSQDSSSHDLVEMFQKVSGNWFNIAQIQMLAEPQMIAQIHQDQVCTSTLVDLIPELCFNGIKHGKATRISINFKFKGDRVLELIVSNDGIVDESALGMGLGSKLLNEVTIFWERKTEGDLAVTHVELAYRAS